MGITDGIGDAVGGLVDKAKEMIGGHDEAVDGAIDAAADKAQAVAPDQADGLIDQAAQAAKDAI